MKAIASLLAVLFSAAALAQQPAGDAATEQRMKGLADELRCLVCQNQTIADSNAALAQDLRSQIRTQIGQGKTDDQIRAYMVERYGDFVLYRPPFRATTLLLWLGPAGLVILGVVVWVLTVRRRKAAVATVPNPTDQRRAEIEKLLDERA